MRRPRGGTGSTGQGEDLGVGSLRVGQLLAVPGGWSLWRSYSGLDSASITVSSPLIALLVGRRLSLAWGRCLPFGKGELIREPAHLCSQRRATPKKRSESQAAKNTTCALHPSSLYSEPFAALLSDVPSLTHFLRLLFMGQAFARPHVRSWELVLCICSFSSLCSTIRCSAVSWVHRVSESFPPLPPLHSSSSGSPCFHWTLSLQACAIAQTYPLSSC